MSRDRLPAVVHSRAELGIDAPAVLVEVHIAGGLPRVTLVGLPETAVRESKDRVRAAILASGYEFPDARITINLAPADLPKHGGRFDLPIAVGVLAASHQLDARRLQAHELIGELGLTGALRPAGGALPAAIACARAGRTLITGAADAGQATLAPEACIGVATTLHEVFEHLDGGAALPSPVPAPVRPPPACLDLAEVQGQHRARRALEVAAAGEHNLVMVGPPGTGKTMLATRLPGILPPMTEAESLESASVSCIGGRVFDPAGWGVRPFRAPHHTASAVALVGGGSRPRPGELSLAHCGVLFLDELPEHDRRVLEALREPLESGEVRIARAAHHARFPASVQLVAAMNPCPCGHLGDGSTRCRCTPSQIQRYRSRVSGPLLDRIDLQVEVPATRPEPIDPAPRPCPEPSEVVRARVVAARRRQLDRQAKANARLSPGETRTHCRLARADAVLLERSIERLGLSARTRDRVLRVSRTAADLAGATAIGTPHLMEALTYRELERHTAPGR